MCWFVWQEAASIKVAPVAIIGRLTFGQMNDRPVKMMRMMVMTMTIMTTMTILMISMIMMSHRSCIGCNHPQIDLPANERSANQKPTYEWSTNERLANCCQSIRDKCVNNQLARFLDFGSLINCKTDWKPLQDPCMMNFHSMLWNQIIVSEIIVVLFLWWIPPNCNFCLKVDDTAHSFHRRKV